MDFLWCYKFMGLLWKNFILKRRRLVALFVEFILALLFAGTLLLTRKFLIIKKSGPFNYSLQPIDELPPFLGMPDTFPGRWELAFVPSKSVVVKGIIELMKRDLRYNFSVQGFSSERDFEEYVKQKNNAKKVLVAIIFDHEFQNSDDPLPFKVKYFLRFSSFQRNKYVGFLRTEGWQTGVLFPPFPSLGPRSERNSNGGRPGYITEGFLVMQHALDQAIMKYYNHTATQKLFQDVTVFVQRFPYPEYSHDYFFTIFDIFTPLVILFIFSMNHLTLIQSIVWEKEKRLKEYLLVSGLSNWMLWAAYFFTFLSLYSFIILLLCMIFFVKASYSDPSLVFVFLLCFAIATIFFSFMVSTFFNKAHFAVSVGGFIYFATYFPIVTVSTNFAQMTFTQKLASCLSLNIAMALGTKFLVKAEMEKTGIKWSNIFSSPKMENFDFAHVLGMFLFDAFIYGLVAWYIEAVFPGEYGVPKPWNFFLLVSSNASVTERGHSKYFEAEPTNLVAGIQIKHLCKEFRVQNTTKIAVKDLSLNLYVGQITVLLGHNGAGKSTTLSILSGLYPATSGEVYINGYDVSQQMVQIRKNLGLCPQQNLLFDYLTVSEHLYFYCVVKGMPRKARLTEIDHMLAAFNLLDKRNAFSCSLSGGMKRRLSMIIALIGGSKVVILDEPTSGMDPASRRATWDILQQYKQDRTILLTTHYMDEADFLGDRIAIMVKGSLRCCGSSVFLKKIYGVGYHIVMVKEAHCNVEEISKLLQDHIPTATLEKNVNNEVSFVLPKEYTHRYESREPKTPVIWSEWKYKCNETKITLVVALEANMTGTQSDLLKYLMENEDCIHLCIVAFSIEVKTNKIILTGLFNNQAYHSPSLTLAILDNILLMTIAGSNASITVFNKPQPHSKVKKRNETLSDGFQVALNIHFGMALLISGFCLLTVTERVTKAKHIQFLSGVYVPVYWLSALLWDFIIFFITCCLLLVSVRYGFLRAHFPSVPPGEFLFSNSVTQNVTIFGNRAFKVGKVSEELSGESDDEDVQNERQRILGQPQEFLDSTVLIKELTKVTSFTVILAVKNISVIIQRGECFGLLGFNGAGKTTTFKILTGEETVTSGDVFIEHVSNSCNQVKSRVGYCPQSDALLEYMTGREIMIMCARLWGVSEPQIQLYVNKWLSSMQLEPHADKLIRTYSGGTKRRLSTAIALMGKTSVVLLDEPSTGMDPVARRLLWDVVTWTRERGKAIIITSHRMEECDAFCTRLAIMVQGKFLCLGSPQQLKNKFGNIYILKVKVKIDAQEDKLDGIKYFITLTFPGSVLKQENQGILTYYIPSKDNSWGKVFGILEDAKDQFNLEDYSISQITLEQIFLAFGTPENTEGDYKERYHEIHSQPVTLMSSLDYSVYTWTHRGTLLCVCISWYKYIYIIKSLPKRNIHHSFVDLHEWPMYTACANLETFSENPVHFPRNIEEHH
uniref:ATP-binding cassette sub-family A member 3 n=1 Tax=Ailuropoda melanoleuca TaxID=9646 RepID=A0A7N5KI67_AILME